MDRLLGVQIVYIPTHTHTVALRNIYAQDVRDLIRKYPDAVQPGFITEVNTHLVGNVFAHYWYPGKVGIEIMDTGQLTAMCDFVFFQSCSNEEVKKALKSLGYGDRIDLLFDL